MFNFDRSLCSLSFFLAAALQSCTINTDCACPDSGGGGAGGSPSGGKNTGGAVTTGGSDTGPPLGPENAFSFFVTSLRAMQELSGSEDGFGGDLRFGETGAEAGLVGADQICTLTAERSAPGNGKTWRAFLSITRGAEGVPVHAIDRVGEGPWYDRNRRLVAENKADLAQTRPRGADAAIANDLPNEDGVPNHAPDPVVGNVDNHDILTGSNETGHLFRADAAFTCQDWTSAVGEEGQPRVGHSWTRMFVQPPGGMTNGIVSGENWMSTLTEAGCAPGAFLIEAGPPGANGTRTVGDGGGYGGIYCLALTP